MALLDKRRTENYISENFLKRLPKAQRRFGNKVPVEVTIHWELERDMSSRRHLISNFLVVPNDHNILLGSKFIDAESARLRALPTMAA